MSAPFQSRVDPWLIFCFGKDVSRDIVERNHRFLEEALELVQALGCSEQDASALVRYVYSRPEGEPTQEAGGVMVTLAALCLAAEIDMHEAGETELSRVWTKVDKIRSKQAAKPRGSALPQAWPDATHRAEIDAAVAAERERCAVKASEVCDYISSNYDAFAESGKSYYLSRIQEATKGMARLFRENVPAAIRKGGQS